jgi:hypothetical protein
MKEAIVVLTCPKFEDRSKACRDAWADASTVPVYFLTGSYLGCQETDEIYRLLPRKTAAMVKWALDMGFDRVFKCDDDVMVVPSNILPPKGSDYSGLCLSNNSHAAFARGFFYHLSRRSLEVLAVATPAPERLWAEDRWVARSLSVAGIRVMADERVCAGFSETFRGRNLRGINRQFCAAAEFRPEELCQFSDALRSGKLWDKKFLCTPQYENWFSEYHARTLEKRIRFRSLGKNI